MKALAVPRTLAAGNRAVTGSSTTGGRPTPQVTARPSARGKRPLVGEAVGKITHALKAGGADIIAAPRLLASLAPKTASLLNRGSWQGA
ncbi:MAG: hypothetical protein ABWX69_00065 [Arthrobacter sp.]